MAEVAGPAPPQLDGPLVLAAEHELSAFDCSKPALDDWLKRHGIRSGHNDTSRTFVVCRGPKVVGYYSLAGGGLQHDGAPGALRRNAPDPVPVTILARLAVDRTEQGRALGGLLLADAAKRAAQASMMVASRALIVHALDAEAATFYSNHNFRKLKPSLPDDLTFFIPMKDIREAL